MVLGGRIELPLLSEPEPKSGASTNFATRAKHSPQMRHKRPKSSYEEMGWTKGFEPSTAGVTILSSTN